MNEPSRLAEMVGRPSRTDSPTVEREVSTDQIRTRVFQYIGAVRYPLRHLPEDFFYNEYATKLSRKNYRRTFRNVASSRNTQSRVYASGTRPQQQRERVRAPQHQQQQKKHRTHFVAAIGNSCSKVGL